MKKNAILLLSCPDQKGITAQVMEHIYKHNGNIVDADQHKDEQSSTFFMRVEWELAEFDIVKDEIKSSFSDLANKFSMSYEVYFTDQKLKTAIFVSKHLHCLYDLLYRYKQGQLDCDIQAVFSNHPDAQDIAKEFGIGYIHLNITKLNKEEQEKKQLEILALKKIDLIILARYHQILTKTFVDSYPQKIINIHHSFLPAFAGGNPYAQAYNKGVKIIGATSHYVTEVLDEGPIIEQDTVTISHKDSLIDLKRKGEDLERMVLNRAVRSHLNHKILSYGHKTVVFD